MSLCFMSLIRWVFIGLLVLMSVVFVVYVAKSSGVRCLQGSRYQFDYVDLLVFRRRESLDKFVRLRYTTLREMGVCISYG